MLWMLFFLKEQILLNNQIPTQDEQRSVKLRIQTNGAKYRRNTESKHPKNTHEDNTHQNTYHRLKPTPLRKTTL